MKRLLFLLIITLNLQLETLNCNAQYVTIPDAGFVQWLTAHGFDSCMNGNMLDTLCPAVLGAKTIFAYSYNISSLQGVQYFKNLDTLICPINNITSLPPLPASIVYLDCDVNDITSLPPLPPNLNYLNCYSNDLTTLPPLPPTLLFLYCSYNKLTSLPALPDSLADMDVTYNHNLSCLPVINKITNFYFDNTNIKCVPDYGVVDTSIPLIDTFPLCSVSNPDGCFPAGVKELSVNSNQLTIFPNPTSGSFTVSTSEKINNAVIEIYNVLGGKVSSIKYQDTHLTGGQARLMTIDISYLPAGMYFVRVSGGGGQFNEKLMVQ